MSTFTVLSSGFPLTRSIEPRNSLNPPLWLPVSFDPTNVTLESAEEISNFSPSAAATRAAALAALPELADEGSDVTAFGLFAAGSAHEASKAIAIVRNAK